MPRAIYLVLSAVLIAIPAARAAAQADAQASYQEAKAALASGKFSEARDLAKKASQTDEKNPEVFLLLGKAHYQLGEVDAAVAAWKRTLALAPNEPLAARMIETLRSQRAGVDVRITLVEAMIRERLDTAALEECRNLLANKALSEAQRARVMTLQAEAQIRANLVPDALRVLQELAVAYPQHADPVQTMLLMAQAKIRTPGPTVGEGVMLLKKLIAQHEKSPAAATARFELIRFELNQATDASRTEALAKWLAENVEHASVPEARRLLLSSYLTLTRQGVKPSPQSDLAPTDRLALAVAAEIYEQTSSPEDVQLVTKQLLEHIEADYGKNGANAAAATAAGILLAAPPPRASHAAVMEATAQYTFRVAGDWLAEEARAGRLATAPERGLPAPLGNMIKLYVAIRNAYPDRPHWTDQAAMAAQVRQHAAKIPWPPAVARLRSPDAWAVEIAWPILEANGDSDAVKAAVELIGAVITEYSGLEGREPREIALGLSRRLVEASAKNDAVWSGAAARHAQLLDAFAVLQLNENVKAGNDALNSKLSEPQKELLATLARHVAREAAYAPAALDLLQKHVQTWTARGHWALAEEMYTTLAKSLPEDARWTAELRVIELWVAEVNQEHQRMTAVGLTVPRQLDPRLQRALLRCYELQAGLGPTSPRLHQVRAISEAVVNHYKALEYDDVAEAAIKLKAEQAVPGADEFAAFQLLVLQEERARREFAQQRKQYGSADKITVTPAFRAAFDAWAKFVTERPASPMATQAIERLFGIARLFQEHSAPQVAAELYGELAKFAAGVKVLAEAPPGATSAADRAAFERAAALDSHARILLAKAMADRKSDTPPPAKLSGEFAAAIAAYTDFAESRPASPQLAEAVNRIMAIAVEHAKVDAWDVAESVYAGLLKSKLKIRRPERLEFARGVCQLGRAMPDHAREVLTLLSSGGLRGAEDTGGESMLASLDKPASSSDKPQAESAPGKAEPPAKPTTVASASPPPTSGAPGMMPPGGVGGGGSGVGMGGIANESADEAARTSSEGKRDTQLLAAIRRQESSRAAQIAQLRENRAPSQPAANQQPQQQAQAQQQIEMPAVLVLSAAELTRQEAAFTAAYEIFQGIRVNHPHAATAEQARAEILVMAGHWRALTQWQRSAALAERFLADNPSDAELPKLRLEIARDLLAWAAKPIQGRQTKQALLTELASRFAAARAELAKVVAEFAKEKAYQQEAQWDLAVSFLTEARVIGGVSPTLARGQYVRAARELRQVTGKYPAHPQVNTVPQMLSQIAQELEGRGFDDEAILVWNELALHDPVNPLAQEAALKIAQSYHQKLKRPLRAVEAYQELNFARGGNDKGLQDAVFQIGTELKNEKRWVEALHVLEAFVDSFPRHPQAGQALAMVGQIHQTNEAWTDAIAAYKRVIAEFQEGQWVQDAKWAIAECTINLSQWNEATQAYRDYAAAYPQDAKVAEANRRIEVLKDLVRYQGLVDEKGQRKSFDAQHQIATIVRQQLANPVKAIAEFRKVAANWPESHLADDAMYEVGVTYLSLGETQKAREALLMVGEKYPSSPLADDALFMVGKSHEEEADKLATLTREKQFEANKDIVQRFAYDQVQSSRRAQADVAKGKIKGLKESGQGKAAELEEASQAAGFNVFNDANVRLFAQQAGQRVEELTATQMADRQDKINSSLRKAVDAYTSASKVAGADKAGDALLQMATIYDKRLKDSKAAMETWLEIVRQFSGTAVAEDASWKIAQYYEREGKHAEAVEAYNAFLRNYRRSPNAGAAQFAVAENYERLGQWVAAMDAYTKYLTNFADGPQVNKAKEQINWIKTYRL